jgi:high affinity Mn2+ porin
MVLYADVPGWMPRVRLQTQRDGHNESFAYTEVDRTLELGLFAKGDWWRRNDRAGFAFNANGIVAAHQQYLALGGLGFLLGDGGLTYGPEKIVE